MTEDPDNIVLRYLRRMDEKLENMALRHDEVMAELRALKLSNLSLAQSDLAHDGSVANLRSRLDRVERRLDLTEDAQ